MELSFFQESLNRLESFIVKENYKGYDPYDVLNSSIPFQKLGKWGQVIPIQIQKRNPVNIRKLLGIKKEYNPKAMGLFLKAYSMLYELTLDDQYAEKAHFFFNWLAKNYTEGFSGYCWGYNFDWASPEKVLKAYSPTIVVTGFVANGVFEFERVFKSEKAKTVLKSIEKFVSNDLFWHKSKTGECLSYSTLKEDCCYNASMLGAEFYAKLFGVFEVDEYQNKAQNLVDFVVDKQHEDGHWNYSINPQTKEERVQIDFHQGYVIDSLLNFISSTQNNDDKYDKSLKVGLSYYSDNQFDDLGRALWRVPKKWPVEIHNQSQGIITFSNNALAFKKYHSLSKKIATWTIENMQGTNGAFYHRIYPSHKIKIPYMRWSQAWMFLALTHLMYNIKKSI